VPEVKLQAQETAHPKIDQIDDGDQTVLAKPADLDHGREADEPWSRYPI
jgi:hypothetical protein